MYDTKFIFFAHIMCMVHLPFKGAKVLKVGRYQRRLSQKPKFVAFFEAFPNLLFCLLQKCQS